MDYYRVRRCAEEEKKIKKRESREEEKETCLLLGCFSRKFSTSAWTKLSDEDFTRQSTLQAFMVSKKELDSSTSSMLRLSSLVSFE